MGWSLKKPDNPPSDESGVRLRAILETAVDAIVTTDRDGRIESFNKAAERMFGYQMREAVGRNVAMLMPGRYAFDHRRRMRSGTGLRVIGRTREITASRKDGSEFPVELALSSTRIGRRQLFTAIIRDVSRRQATERELHDYRTQVEQMVAERTSALEAANRQLKRSQTQLQRANERLRQMAHVDELTGIGNRRAFDERLDLEWRRCRREHRPLTLVICDVDLFKDYNDHYGHPAGDDCLRQVARTFSSCYQRAKEFPARYGGEEFAAVLSDVGIETAVRQAETLRCKIRSQMIEHDALGPGRFVTVSAGIASCVPQRHNSPADLVGAADAALYRAKQNGRDRIELAPPQTD